MSEVTGLLNIHTATVKGGFTDRGGQAFVTAKMELQGTVMTLFHGEHRGKVAKGIQTSFTVNIDFTKEQERSEEIEDHVTKAYIGLCYLRMGKEIDVSLRITLPITMYQQILLLGGEDIVCDSIQDAIESPTPREVTAHVGAYVTRVSFEKLYWWERK